MDKKKIKALLKLQRIVYNTDGLYLEKNHIVKDKITRVDKVDKKSLLLKLKTEVESCKKCKLWETRINTVFGEGNENAELVFIGEGPGYDEDKQGKPFVGRAGDLLTKILSELGLSREEVYITNIVKCHPVVKPDPYIRNNDRPPNDEEIESCLSYIKTQIKIISPKIICCLGATAAKVLTSIEAPLYEIRGKKFVYKDNTLTITVIPTYHPAAVLRNPALEPLLRNDIKFAIQCLKSSK